MMGERVERHELVLSFTYLYLHCLRSSLSLIISVGVLKCTATQRNLGGAAPITINKHVNAYVGRPRESERESRQNFFGAKLLCLEKKEIKRHTDLVNEHC